MLACHVGQKDFLWSNKIFLEGVLVNEMLMNERVWRGYSPKCYPGICLY